MSESLIWEFKETAEIVRNSSRCNLRVKVLTACRTVQRILINVSNNCIVEQIFHAQSTADEASHKRRGDIVRDPIRHDGDVLLVLGEEIRVEDELFGIAAVSWDHNDAVIGENRFDLEEI